MSQQQDNPFAPREKLPSVSWAGAPVGATITGRIIEQPSEVQSTDFATGKPDTWDNGDPKMSVVTRMEINGEKRALWCVRPSALYGAIVDALQHNGPGYMEVGGTLSVTYTGDKPSEKAGMNPAKQFTAQYQPPVSNAFAPNGNGAQQSSWQQQPQQQQQSSWQQQPAQQSGYQERRPTQPAYAQPAAGPDYPQQPAQQQQQPDEPPF